MRPPAANCSRGCTTAAWSAAEKIETVRGIYDRLGVRKITEKAIADYFRNADRILNSLEVGIERIVPLQELGETLLNRKK